MRGWRPALVALLLIAGPASAQAPFDMSPEAPAGTTPAQPGEHSPAATPAATVAPGHPAGALRRYLIPFSSLILTGESDSRSWGVYLTPQQAASPVSLSLGYQNAIVVAPEASRLHLSINGTRLVDTAVESADNSSDLSIDIPAGLLHPGLNQVTVEVSQRHRTDCTIQSTYELWTRFDSARTFLTFRDAAAGSWKGVDDIRAIGVDEKGRTEFTMVVPSLVQSVATAPVVRLAEALAILSNMPNQSFDLRDAPGDPGGPGRATIVMGPASDLAGVLASLPPGAESSPTAGVVDDPRTGPSTLVITGPSWQAVGSAVADIAGQFDLPANSQRTGLSTMSWHMPDIPTFFSGGRMKLADLGVSTQEFTGRRLRVDFSVGIPSDFYADSYGDMTLLLDAAYSDEVLPGSHIDVYVNDNIAATVPITTSRGEILRHLPIAVTMRHFRPGDNTISLQAVLSTEADALCAPGATATNNSRFVLFDSSELVIPTFARIGRRPNLNAISGTGFPYDRATEPVPLIVDNAQSESLSAAVTLLARMSVAAGRSIPVDPTVTAAAVANRSAIFVGPVSQIPPAILAQVGVASDSSSTWGTAIVSDKPSTSATFDEWREKLSGRGWRGQISSFQEWINRTFGMSGDTLRLVPGSSGPFSPPAGSTLLVAQQANPEGTGTWTMVTAPDASKLKVGVEMLTRQEIWRQLGGHASVVDTAAAKLQTEQAARFGFVVTQPFSLTNYRLIIANWLSANPLSYALLLTVLSILLGLATAGLLATLGRRS